MGSENGSSIILASNIGELETLSKRIAKSNLVPTPYRDKPDDLYVAMLMGNELGIGPMQAIQNIDVIEGRPSSRSRLKKTLAMKHPACEYFIMIESSDEKATYETKKRGDPGPVRLSYTIAQATKAGLTRKPNWAAHPAAMLRARCEGQLADIVYSDATLGLPPDEYSDFDESTIGEPIATTTKVVDVTPGAPDVTKGTDALKATIEKKKTEKKNEGAQDTLFTETKDVKPAPSPPKTEATTSGNFTVEKNADGSETMKRKPRNLMVTPEATKPPPPVGEQVPPKVEPVAVSGEGTQKVQPETPMEEFDPLMSPVPPANANMETWFYECCLALAKLRGLDAATLKAELKAVGAKGPKTVTKEHFETLGRKYPPAKPTSIKDPSLNTREPGDDTESIAADEKKEDLF